MGNDPGYYNPFVPIFPVRVFIVGEMGNAMRGELESHVAREKGCYKYLFFSHFLGSVVYL